MKGDPWIGAGPAELLRRLEASLEERLRGAVCAFEAESDRLRGRPVPDAETVRRLEIQARIVRQLERLRARTSGASLREEVERLLREQSAFQASARVVAMLDDLLLALANGI